MSKNHSGLFLGIIAGTALGILFAPKKGKELRESIKKERREGGYGFESIKDGFVEMGQEVITTAKMAYDSDPVQEQIDKAKQVAEEKFQEGKKQARKAVKKATKKVAKKAKTTAKRAKKKVGKFTKKKIGK
ncbi:YtxH domain-containing protein [bacterium]|nr:YtxH domain-containing protein [bacterium]